MSYLQIKHSVETENSCGAGEHSQHADVNSANPWSARFRKCLKSLGLTQESQKKQGAWAVQRTNRMPSNRMATSIGWEKSLPTTITQTKYIGLKTCEGLVRPIRLQWPGGKSHVLIVGHVLVTPDSSKSAHACRRYNINKNVEENISSLNMEVRSRSPTCVWEESEELPRN